MRLRSTKNISFKIMILFGGILAPFASIAHWEGFEAADPSTPSAILRYDSLMGHYKNLEDITVSWPIISSHDTDQVQPDHSNMDHESTHEGHTTEIEQ